MPSEFKEYHVGEPKIDGSRYMLYIGCDPFDRQSCNALLSRHISKVDGLPVDKTKNIPQVTDHEFLDLQDTILDGEVFLKDFHYTSSIMNSSPSNAIAKQESDGWLNYYVFDVLVFRGQDIRGWSYTKRRKVLKAVVKRMGLEHVKVVPQYKPEQIPEMFSKIVKAGGEGLIIKDIRCGYGVNWCKLKRSYDVSCFISGYKEGNGKYRGNVGAIELSVYSEDGKTIAVGWASGFTDQLRNEINEDREGFIGVAVDIFAHELSVKGVRLRHPTFHRIRNDVNAEDCTLEKLKDDFKKKARTNRWKR